MKTWSEQQQELGKELGREIGKMLKAQEDILRVLEAIFDPVPPAVAARVRAMDDEAALDALLVRVATATTLADTGPLAGLN